MAARFIVVTIEPLVRAWGMSLQQEAIRYASRNGYIVDRDGGVTSKAGRKIKLHRGASKRGGIYKSFGVSFGGKVVRMFVHRLHAFQKYGEAAISDGTHVRHLDGDSENNSWDNIAIGTASDNSMDRPAEIRKISASKANQKYSPEFVEAIRAAHASGWAYRKIEIEFSVPRSTLCYYLSRTAKRTSYTHPLEAAALSAQAQASGA